MRSTLLFVPMVLLVAPLFGSPARRPLTPDDVYNIADVADPQVSPDGRFVVYTVSNLDRKTDERVTHIFMMPLSGGAPWALTSGAKSETSPRFSPDGRYLAFLSSREGKKTQVFLMNRAGGEATRVTDYRADVSFLSWSPDSKRLALVVTDPDPDDKDQEASEGEENPGAKSKSPRPIVIRRRQFMRDGEGYLREFRKHIHVFDVEKRTSAQITSGPYDDTEPAWSPDGKSIAFSSNRTEDPDSNQNSDIFIVEAEVGRTPRSLEASPGTDTAPSFSPDGSLVAFVAGCDPKDLWYGPSELKVAPVAGGPVRSLTESLDRNILKPRFSRDGRWLYFIVEEEGNEHVARVSLKGGGIERVIGGERDVQELALGPKGEVVLMESQPDLPSELSWLSPKGLKRLTFTNDEFLKGIELGHVERFKAKSADGTQVDAFLTHPPQAAPGTRLPTVLRIHGGPAEQYSTAFEIQWQVLAAQGFAVVTANPRGSTGYGRAYSRAIWADWGHKDFEDVMAAVDQAISMGVADPDHLGVGGWSYGGIMTDYVITKSTRFKAAISGASEANYLADYGTDHYQYEWETELGLPWKNTEFWTKLSPWFNVEKVKTPTLILCGSADMNVPLLNSEQLYQALRRLGIETELVIYPDATHDIERPSYQKDRLERYVAWYSSHLKGSPAHSSP
jgi:dipeptidyl aminopeptidase/acylaminoacyl peptidase